MIPSICITCVYDGTNVSISDDSLYMYPSAVFDESKYYFFFHKNELPFSKFSVTIELQLYFIHAETLKLCLCLSTFQFSGICC
jgi:hypothetical protein